VYGACPYSSCSARRCLRVSSIGGRSPRKAHHATAHRIPRDDELQIANLHAEAYAFGLGVGYFVREVSPEARGCAQGGFPDVDLTRLQERQVEHLSRDRDAGVREVAMPKLLGFHETDRVAHGIGAVEEDDIERLDRHFAKSRHVETLPWTFAGFQPRGSSAAAAVQYHLVDASGTADAEGHGAVSSSRRPRTRPFTGRDCRGTPAPDFPPLQTPDLCVPTQRPSTSPSPRSRRLRPTGGPRL
jgi:hypothetical protein